MGRPLRPVARPAPRAGRRARPARARGRGRARARTSGPSSTTTPPTCSSSCHAVRVDAETGRARRDRDRRVHQPALAHHGPQGRGVLDGDRSSQRWDRSPDLASARRRLPALRAARRRRRRLLRRRAGVRRLLRRGQRGHLLRARRSSPAEQRHWFEMRRALVRFHRLVVPDARGGQRADAPRAHGRRRASCTPTTRTSTTTSCGSASRPTRCATSSARSSRPTSACATTGRTRS